ncbi:MAG: universal stress protein [Aquaspirillum sp.]
MTFDLGGVTQCLDALQKQEESSMYKNIMVAVDHSPQSPQVLDEAIKLAKMSGARLHLVTIANLYEFAFDEAGRRDEGRLQVQAESKARQVLEPHLIRAEQEGVNVSAHPVVSWGAGEEIAKALINEAQDSDAEVLVMGTHGRTGLAHLFLGSVAEAVIRSAPMPVLILRSPDRH